MENKIYRSLIQTNIKNILLAVMAINPVDNYFNNMIEESKYRSEVMKKHFSKDLVMTKGGNEYFRTLLNVGSVTMIILIMMLK